MDQKTTQKAEYGNWVSKWMLYIPAAIALVFLCLIWASYFLIIPAVFFLLVFAYFAYAYYRFSAAGGNIQAKIWDMILDRLEWDGRGKAIDIGCGNASVAIKLAAKYPQAEVTGIDYWGGKWGYSKETCESNARIERVGDRTQFVKASASKLPFEDGYFDAAISNFVFHEVQDAKDKRDVVKEALRVVRKGGAFAFQDLFAVKRMYGEIDDLLALIREWGTQDVRFINTSDAAFIPALMKLPFMVGSIGIIYGKK